MDKYILKIFSGVLFMMMWYAGFSQVSDESIPASFNIKTKSYKIIPTTVLDSVRVKLRLQEDVMNGIFNRYGVIQDINVNIKEEGVQTTYDGVNIWQYELSCPDALSLGIFFETYCLPEGAKVFIYNQDRTKLVGGFTQRNNNVNDQLMIADFEGNSLIIEYNEPVNANFSGALVIGQINTAYTRLSSETGRLYINCPEGDDWQVEKNAVCLMTFNDFIYSYYCTGSLVNNVRQDGTPYFLTANHCISNEDEANTLITYFNYENSDCGSSDALMNQSLSGATLRSTSDYSDFTLLELTEVPPEEYFPYFAGWDATGNIPEQGTCIHHPDGDAKCIALDKDVVESYVFPILWNNDQTSDANTHWVAHYEYGADEIGSSGSALFNENGRIVGQLHGGDDSSSYFGKFSLSWDYSSSSDAQLKDWLDPDNTGLKQLDGYDLTGEPIAAFSSDVELACLGTSVYITDESKNLPDEWQWNISPATYVFTNGTNENTQDISIEFLEEGTYNISLIVTNEYGIDTLKYENMVVAVAELPVTFVDVPDEMTFCAYELDEYEFVAEGAQVFSFELTAEEFFDVEINENMIALTVNDEADGYGSFDTYLKVTGSHGDCSAADSLLLHVVSPANDKAQQAIALKLGNNYSFTNECGTVEENETISAGFDLDNTVWFSFEGTSNKNLTIEVEGILSQIAVYQADSYADLVSGASLDYEFLKRSSNVTSTITRLEDLYVEPGKTYWLQVDGYEGDKGTFNVSLLGNTIEVYPNPSDGIFNMTVSSFNEGNALFEVFDLNGKRIYSGMEQVSLDENTYNVDLSGNPSGMYIFRATINGLSMTKKLVLVF